MQAWFTSICFDLKQVVFICFMWSLLCAIAYLCGPRNYFVTTNSSWSLVVLCCDKKTHVTLKAKIHEQYMWHSDLQLDMFKDSKHNLNIHLHLLLD